MFRGSLNLATAAHWGGGRNCANQWRPMVKHFTLTLPASAGSLGGMKPLAVKRSARSILVQRVVADSGQCEQTHDQQAAEQQRVVVALKIIEQHTPLFTRCQRPCFGLLGLGGDTGALESATNAFSASSASATAANNRLAASAWKASKFGGYT